MRFQLYTYSLNPSNQGTILKDPRGKNAIFDSIIFEHFKKRRFSQGGQNLGFVTHHHTNRYLLASIGKVSSYQLGKPPEDSFEKDVVEDWKNCFILFDLDPTRQQIAIEYKPSVFKTPFNTLRKLSHEINSILLPVNYEFSLKPQLIVENFWKVAEKYFDEIKSLKFEFTAPNVLNLNDSLNESNRAVKEAFGATEIEAKISNPHGILKIPKDQPFLQDALKTAEGGAARIIMKSKKGKIFDSKENENIKTETLQLEIENASKEAQIEAIEQFFSSQ